MESIRKTVENVERRFGEALGTRDTTVSSLKQQSGLGPPDMCWLQKRVKKAFRKKSEVRGSYHWLVGLDVRGETSIRAYFYDLVNNLEKPGFFQGLVPREYTIDRGIFCCHDPFSSVDIWCDVEANGQMMARSIDLDGNIRSVSAQTWSGARLGCFLRSELYDSTSTISSTKNLRRLKPFSNHRQEDDFLDFVITFYKEGIVQKCLERLQWDKAFGLEPEDMDIVSGTLLHYFRRSQRWQKALQFFTRLQEFYPPAGVYLCVVYRELDNPDGAMTVLKSCVEEKGHCHAPLLIAYGKQLLLTGNIESAFEMAKKSIGKAQTSRPAWLLLQSCFSRRVDHALAMKTLNLMPGPAMPDEKDAIFQSFPPEPKSVTRPSDRQYDPELIELRRTLQEGHQPSAGQIQKLPAHIIAPSQVGNSGVLANCAPAYCTQAATLRAYRILLSIVREVGWENFIALRSKLFIVADVALQGRSSALSRVRDSLRQSQPQNTPYISVSISQINYRANGDDQKKLVSVSLDLVHDPSLASQASNLSTKSKNQLTTSHDVLDNGSLANTESANVEISVNDQSQGHVDDSSQEEILEEPIDTGDEDCLGSSEAFGASNTDDPKLDLRKGGQSGSRTVMIPRRALESAEYLEKLKSLAENGEGGHILKSLTPRQKEPSPSPPVASENSIEQERKSAPAEPPIRRRSPMPPPSPVSSFGSEFPGGADKDGERWLVKEVSLGIKDRVRYFESMASKKAADEEEKLMREKEEEAVQSLKPLSTRKGNSMTMMEFLTAGWDDSMPSTAEDSPQKEVSEANEESECGDSLGGEIQPEEGTQEGTASQMVVRHGWMSVDWDDVTNERIVKTNDEKLSTVDASPPTEVPATPFLTKGCSQGVEVPDKLCKLGETGPDGSWIVDIIEDLEPCECSEWLDELIMALWEDLAVYTELRRVDRKLRAKTGRCVAEWILGTDEGTYAFDSLDDSHDKQEKILFTGETPSLPKSTSADWMYRGMLCERLERIPEAEQAYRVCLFKGFNLTALLGLSRIYASWGWSRESMQVLNKLAELHERYHEFSKDPFAPQSMYRAISKLVTCVGNMEVRTSAAKCHPMVKYTVDEVLKWQRRSGAE